MNDTDSASLRQQLEAEKTIRTDLENRLREMQGQLQKATEDQFLLEALMLTMPDHVYFKDKDSRIIRINQALAGFFGVLDPKEAIGKTDFDFFTEDHASQARSDELRVMSTGQALTQEEKETWADRPDTWVLTTKAPLRNAEGQIVGTFGISRDITARRAVMSEMEAQIIELGLLNHQLKETHHQLLQSEKMASVGQLAAGVAHEINNPMGFINSNLHSLRREVLDLLELIEAYENAQSLVPEDSPQKRRVAEVKKKIDIDYLTTDIVNLLNESDEGVRRVVNIVTNLKDYSRVDAKDWRLTNLEEGVESTLSIAWNIIKYKAEVRRNFAGVPQIECIGSQINQVIMNLLVNAAQAIAEQGTITITTGFNEDEVWIEISDTGSGIAPDNLPRIFEPFFTTKPLGQGTGLGLSLSYKIVQAHNGTLTVESRLHQGTTFRISLPRTQPRASD